MNESVNKKLVDIMKDLLDLRKRISMVLMLLDRPTREKTSDEKAQAVMLNLWVENIDSILEKIQR